MSTTPETTWPCPTPSFVELEALFLGWFEDVPWDDIQKAALLLLLGEVTFDARSWDELLGQMPCKDGTAFVDAHTRLRSDGLGSPRTVRIRDWLEPHQGTRGWTARSIAALLKASPAEALDATVTLVDENANPQRVLHRKKGDSPFWRRLRREVRELEGLYTPAAARRAEVSAFVLGDGWVMSQGLIPDEHLHAFVDRVKESNIEDASVRWEWNTKFPAAEVVVFAVDTETARRVQKLAPKIDERWRAVATAQKTAILDRSQTRAFRSAVGADTPEPPLLSPAELSMAAWLLGAPQPPARVAGAPR